jgi:hypothetical protein
VPARRCGMDKLGQYDFFLQSTFYDDAYVCDDFDDVKYGSGYGVILNESEDTKRMIKSYLNGIDWKHYSMRATNHCRHIGKKHIIQALMDGGWC